MSHAQGPGGTGETAPPDGARGAASAAGGDRPVALVIGRFHLDSVARHIAETLEAMGLEVVRFETSFRVLSTAGPIRKRLEQARTRVSELAGNFSFVRNRFKSRLLESAARPGIELSLVCHDFLQPGEVTELRRVTRAPVALWYPDSIANFGKAWFLNAPYDALFFKDPYTVDSLRRTTDRPVHYLPECFNPARHPNLKLSDEDRKIYGCDIATAGNLYTYRAAFFEQLAGYDVKIWGNPPPRWMDISRIEKMVQRRYLIHEDKSRGFLGAKIVVNNLHPAEIWGINARAFEIAGVGGFQLIDDRPGLGQLFEDGSELVSFGSIGELRDRIDHYLERPEERAAIARRGRERALREHTFEARLSLIRRTLRGEAEGFPMPRIRVTSG